MSKKTARHQFFVFATMRTLSGNSTELNSTQQPPKQEHAMLTPGMFLLASKVGIVFKAHPRMLTECTPTGGNGFP